MKRMLCAVFATLTIGGAAEQPRQGPSARIDPLRISDTRRHLVYKDHTPFFYLADTAWELFHRLNREDAERYLENRRQKGFTVIQAVLLAEIDGVREPNPYGDLPLTDQDPTKLNPAYFKHVDYVIKLAEKKGMYVALLPTWGDKVSNEHRGLGPQIFNPENAFTYGQLLATRFRDTRNILWIIGGDWTADTPNTLASWKAMGRGVREGDAGRHLITFHPRGGRNSSEWFHNEEWLDFNMHQSGHRRYIENYKAIERDYNLKPVKPTMDSEPRYETAGTRELERTITDYDVRQAAYWNLFAGGFGHTYGCQGIWQMHAPGRPARGPSSPKYWYDLIDLPGAWDMMHVRALMESRPMLTREPDQSILVSDPGVGSEHLQATRGEGYAFVYSPKGKPFRVAMDKIGATQTVAWWFDPRTGEAARIGSFDGKGDREFTPPSSGERDHDWILVIDNASRAYAPPGQRRKDDDIQDLTYRSLINDTDVAIKVYLPPGYSSSKERYPVVYNLHGAGGGGPERQWDRTRDTIRDAIGGGKVRPVIYVFVNGMGDTFFVDYANGSLKVESSIVKELIPFIDKRYRTVASRQGRAVDGFSMGGFGALMMALRHPDLFSSVVSYGAALIGPDRIRFGADSRFASKEQFDQYDPTALVARNPAKVRSQLRIRMVCGEEDRLFAANVKMKELLDRLQIPVSWAPVPGVAHDTGGLYRKVGLESLIFLEQTMPKPRTNAKSRNGAAD